MAVLLVLAGSEVKPGLSEAAALAVERFEQRIVQSRAELTAAGPSESWKGELARRVALDQAGRRHLSEVDRLSGEDRKAAWDAAWKTLGAIDRSNVVYLRSIMPERGWFSLSRDGVGATRHAFFIVQHSDDLALMKDVLGRMEPLLARKDIPGGQYALLYDRIAVREHRPQRYGSQVGCVGGRTDFFEIEAPEGIEQRRKALGMSESFATYKTHFSERLGRPC